MDLGEGAYLEYHPAWLPPLEASALMDALVARFEWERKAIRLFGREVWQPRLIAWAGALPYEYSGQVLEPRPFLEPLDALTERVSKRADSPFNHVLLNRYRDGQDSMGMHADDEPELGPNPLIAAISLGVARRFVLAHRRRKGERHVLTVEHGSLLIMGGTIQHRFRHGVPKQQLIVAERVNLTFRRLLQEHP